MLAEQYRPTRFEDVIGQDKVVAKIQALKARGKLGGRAFMVTGKSGHGKTTVARLIAAEIADDFSIMELDAADLTAAAMEGIKREMTYRGFGAKSGKAWIVNEAHGLRNDQVRKLLTLLEPDGGLPDWIVFIFTTTLEGANLLFDGCDDANPLLSRCFPLALNSRDMAPLFAASVVAKARSAGLLNGKPDEYYTARAVGFLKKESNNCRALWQAVDAGYLTDADHD